MPDNPADCPADFVEFWQQRVAARLRALDWYVRLREEPHEIECEVQDAAKETAALFFLWLTRRGLVSGAEVPAEMVRHFIVHVYLDCSDERPRPMLSTILKRQLEEFLGCTEFAVSQAEWDAGINPPDALLSFFELLEECDYPIDLPRKRRAITSIRRTMVKFPVHPALAEAIETKH